MLPLPVLTYVQTKRFWSRVDTQGPDECWNWTGDLTEHGHGRFSVKDRGYKAHRIAYFLHTSYDPVNVRVSQTCGNPACCNPAHLTTLSTRIGANHHRAHLTEAEVLEIRALYLGGNSQRALSRGFNVSPSTIYKIVNRLTWTHI